MILNLSRIRIALALLGLGLLAGGCGKKHEAWSIKNSTIAAHLKEFTSEKAAQANAATTAEGKEMPPEFKTFFAAAEKGDWLTVSNTFRELRKHAPQYEHTGSNDMRLSGTAWEGIKEIWGAYDFFAVGSEKLFVPLGSEIIKSIPTGSIYFGGTDAGRFLITALAKSQVNGDPFFVLTQNALADNNYLAYLRSMYGEKIYLPTDEDLKSSANVSGQESVIKINSLLAKVIFDKNPDREFYLEESFPIQWMYPYLEPHGLVLKLNRQPLDELSEKMVQQDHDYWAKYLTPLIGDWLKDDTSVEEVCAFAKKVHSKHNLSGFKGNPEFAQNDMAGKVLSKLRSTIAGIYTFRLASVAPKSEAERRRLIQAADFAFRQAVALCPNSPEAINGYANFLRNQHRTSDADLIAKLKR
jgi:hypothetical protein